MQTPPTEVVLRFSEPVGVSLGAVKVLCPEGQRVDEGEVVPRAGGREVAVPLRGELGHGTYLVSWRVVSLDSHAISGASTFNKLVFKTLRTYADGDVVRWIEEQAPGGEEPEHPAPALELAAAAEAPVCNRLR